MSKNIRTKRRISSTKPLRKLKVGMLLCWKQHESNEITFISKVTNIRSMSCDLIVVAHRNDIRTTSCVGDKQCFHIDPLLRVASIPSKTLKKLDCWVWEAPPKKPEYHYAPASYSMGINSNTITFTATINSNFTKTIKW